MHDIANKHIYEVDSTYLKIPKDSIKNQESIRNE